MAGPEARLEANCRKKAKQQGCRLLKFTSPGRRGFNDRILIIPLAQGTHPHYIWVEFKAPGRRPTELQEERHRELRDLGCHVEVIDNEPDFLRLIADARGSQAVPE